jgi:hypothetical protein
MQLRTKSGTATVDDMANNSIRIDGESKPTLRTAASDKKFKSKPAETPKTHSAGKNPE